MKVTMTRDYNEYKRGERYEVSEATAKNLFKLRAASVDRMMDESDQVIVKVNPAGWKTSSSQPIEVKPKRKSFFKRFF